MTLRVRFLGLLAAVPLACIGWSVLAASAAAQGGTTVETAPEMKPGVQVSGNTASDSVISHSLPDRSCASDVELWKLNLTAGDQVLLKGDTEAPAEQFSVAAMPPGVTDTQLAGNSEIPGNTGGEWLEHGLSFAASRSGAWLIAVGSCDAPADDGPYQLTATVYPGAFVPGAGGGATVETAPELSAGVTVSGNTASDSVIDHSLPDRACASDVELWKLNLTAGDQVLLKGDTEAPAGQFSVAAMPPGVTDAQLAGSSEITGGAPGEWLEHGLSFAASKSGAWLIAVGSCDSPTEDGPYQLTATVTPPSQSPPPSPPAPTLGAVSLTSRSFTAKSGTTLHLTVSEAGTVVISVSQVVAGHKTHGRCNVHARRGSHCNVSVHRTTLSLTAAKGSDVLAFRVANLKPGSYIATITAHNGSGRASKTVVLAFTIKAPARHHHRK